MTRNICPFLSWLPKKDTKKVEQNLLLGRRIEFWWGENLEIPWDHLVINFFLQNWHWRTEASKSYEKCTTTAAALLPPTSSFTLFAPFPQGRKMHWNVSSTWHYCNAKLFLRFIKFQGVQVVSFLRRTKGYFGRLFCTSTCLHVYEEHEWQLSIVLFMFYQMMNNFHIYSDFHRRIMK